MWLRSAVCSALLLVALTGCASSPPSELDTLRQRFPLGATHQQLSASIAAHCANAVVHEYTPAEAAPYAQQTQVDCFGYMFAGKPRKIELLINEGRLGFYWLMLDEFETTQASLSTQLSNPACISADYVIYEDDAIALRREPIEILVSLAPDFRAITGGCPLG